MQNAPAVYLIVQAALTTCWWGLLVCLPRSRAFFKPEGAPDYALLSFWFADLTCVAAGSGLAGWWLFRQDRRAGPVLWFTSGAIVYAALYCAALTASTGEAVLATALMSPAALITVAIAAHSAVP